jgi:vacuolar-type H+-ATPase subunit I/STV1
MELPKARKIAKSKAVSDMTPAERWALYFLYNADRTEFGRKLLEEITEKEEGVKMATEVVRGFSAEENRYFQQMSEEKYEWDRFNLIAESEDRGRRAERKKANTEIKKINTELKKTDAELKKANAKREAAVNALRAKGVSEDIIKEVYGDTNPSKEQFSRSFIQALKHGAKIAEGKEKTADARGFIRQVRAEMEEDQREGR